MELKIHMLKGLKISCFGHSQWLVPASRVVNYGDESTLRVHGCRSQACRDTHTPKTVVLELERSDGIELFFHLGQDLVC